MKKFIFILILLLSPCFTIAATEDFTTYEAHDDDGVLASTTDRITGTEVSGTTESEYYYKDYTADYFDELNIDFTIEIQTSGGAYGEGGMGLSNSIGSMQGWGTTDVWAGGDWRGDTTAWIYLADGNMGTIDYKTGLSLSTPYYCTLERAAGNDTIYLYIYSDSARETLVDTLSVSGYGTTKWQYIYGFAHQDTGNARYWTGYIENMNLNIEEETSTPMVTGQLNFPEIMLMIMGISLLCTAIYYSGSYLDKGIRKGYSRI